MTKPLLTRIADAPFIMLGPDRWTELATGDQTDGHFDVFLGQVHHLQGPPLHIHHGQDDTMYVLSGTLKVQVGEEIYDVGEGDLISAPRGVPHTFTNVVEDQPVTMLSIVTPGHFNRALRELCELPMPPSPEALAPFEEKHGFVVCGPPLPVRLGLVT